MEFLGEEHAALVDRLHQQVLDIQAGLPVERLVLLEAESGAGKSRVIRELYRRLRSTQSVNQDGEGYWPALDDDPTRGAPGREALPSRKVIGPPTDGFTRPAGTLPDFFWLQVQCGQAPSGALIPTIELMWPSLRAHAKFVAESWRRVASLRERGTRKVIDQARDEAKSLGTEASIEALSRVLAAFDVAVPGLGWIATSGVRAATSYHKRQEFKGSIEAGGELSQGLQPPEELALQLLRMAHGKLPLVVVVEDAHLMDEGLGEALRLLAESGPQAPPVLVIVTAWPEGRTRDGYQQWRQELLSPVDGQVRGLLVADGSAYPFPSLNLNDRVQLVREYAADTDRATAELMANKWTNPYALRLALSSGRMQRRIRDDAFNVTPEHLEAMPVEIQDLYRDRWRELPEGVRQALMLAAGALPDPGDDGSVWPYLVDVVTHATAQSGLLNDPGQLTAALGEASNPLEWSRIEDRDLDLVAFREWVLQRIALDNYQAEYDKAESRGFTESVAEEIARRINHARGDGYLVPASDPSGLPLARWLLALQPGRDDDAGAAAALTIAHAATREEPIDVVRLLTEPDRLQVLATNDPWNFWARGILTAALADAGRIHEAIDQTEALLTDQTNVLGPDHPDTLTTRGDLVWMLADAGRVHEAIEQNEELLANKLRVLGPDHPDALATRNALAVALALAGRLREAIEQIQLLLVDRVRVLGPDHPNTLATRNNLAEAMRRAGRLNEAIEQNEALLVDCERVLGPNDVGTLLTRNNLAASLADAGRLEESMERNAALLVDRLRVLGPDHPDTLLTRNNLLRGLADVGRAQEAVAQYPGLLEDMLRVLGPDHPSTLETRGDFTIALTDVGRAQEAIGQYRELLDDMLRVLGEDHPDTLRTRSNFALALTEAGRGQEAIEQHERLLVDKVRVLEADHIDTLATRSYLLRTLASEGRVEEALDQYPGLLQDYVRVLGSDHTDTVRVRQEFQDLAGD